MTDKESLTHEIEDDLAARNRNWNKVDRNTTNIAENTTNIAENTTNINSHMAESVSDGVHGLQVERGTATITINEAYQGTAHVSFGKTFKTPPFATAVAANIPGGYPFNLCRVYNQSTSGASFSFRENTDRHMTGTLEIEWIAIGF